MQTEMLVAGVEEMSFEVVKIGVNGVPTGEFRSNYWHKNCLIRWRVRLALWLGAGKLKVR